MRPPRPSLVLLGIAIGGFFDGILLHQILQWHHLLSLVPGIAGLREQILWDGLFHAGMYALAAVALWRIWRRREEGLARMGRAQVAGLLLAGFGLWHVLDSILSHWVLGIHRIKEDSPHPLVWDLIWFVAFGCLPLLWGWYLNRRPPGAATLQPGMAAFLAVLTLGAGAWAMRPPADQPFTTVVFARGMDDARIDAAIARVGATLVWADQAAGIAVLAMAPADRWRLFGQGALLVGGSGLPAGCLDWSRPDTAV